MSYHGALQTEPQSTIRAAGQPRLVLNSYPPPLSPKGGDYRYKCLPSCLAKWEVFGSSIKWVIVQQKIKWHKFVIFLVNGMFGELEAEVSLVVGQLKLHGRHFLKKKKRRLKKLLWVVLTSSNCVPSSLGKKSFKKTLSMVIFPPFSP